MLQHGMAVFPKTAQMIALTTLMVVTMARMETALADAVVTQQKIQVEHVRIVSTKPFAQVEAVLEGSIPKLDPAIALALSNGEIDRAKEIEHGTDLYIFLKRDHGALLRAYGQTRKALQYEIGNPLTASTMTQYELPAALYAPLRVVLYENAAGAATFEYDKPSTLFGQFGDAQVTAVGRKLDDEIEHALRRAAE